MNKEINTMQNKAYQMLLACSAIFLLSLISLFYASFYSATEIWLGSEIFNHCLFVIPGAFYLIYRQKDKLLSEPLKPTLIPLPAILVLYFLHVFGSVGDIKVFTHIALFFSLPLIIISLIGFKAALKIPFPLVFFILAIPIGEQLIPHLQEITAHMAVFLLNITGLSVFRNGLYIDIPAGRFLVAEACSGISFFISSVAFGGLYAHLSYRSNKAKILFFLFAAIIPIFANALRVYGIIIIAHLSDMKHAVGADHLVYGWFFYCLVLFIIFSVGEFFRKNDKEESTGAILTLSALNLNKLKLPILTLSILSLGTAAWQYSIVNNKNTDFTFTKTITFPQSSVKTELSFWGISFVKPSQELNLVINKNDAEFYLHSAIYTPDNKDAELISSLNRLFDIERWSLANNTHIPSNEQIPADANSINIVSSTESSLQIVQWYILDGLTTGSRLKAELYSTYKTMLAKEKPGISIACSFIQDTPPNQQQIDTCATAAREIQEQVAENYTQK